MTTNQSARAGAGRFGSQVGMRVLSAMLVALAGALVAAGLALARRTDAATPGGSGAANVGGNVIALADAACGCDGIRKLIKAEKKPDWTNHIPTRCRDGNRSGKGGPVNDLGVLYPPDRVAPPRYAFPMGYAGSPNYKPQAPIPFPGWPVGRTRVSSWGTMRDKYKANYSKQGGVAPGAMNQSSVLGFSVTGLKPVKSKPWRYWQIHHILEQQFGGTDDDANLVPVFSMANTKARRAPGAMGRPNLHNEFTQWWEHVTVDGDFDRKDKNLKGSAKYRAKHKIGQAIWALISPEDSDGADCARSHWP